MDIEERKAIRKSMLERLVTQLDILEEKSKKEETTVDENVKIATTISSLIDSWRATKSTMP